MFHRKTLPKVLLLMAVFVFFSANTIYILDSGEGKLHAGIDTRYHFDFEKSLKKKAPYLNLKSAILVDYSNGQVIYSKNADQKRPIASISKLIAAMVILDSDIDLSQTQTITREDAYRSSKSRLRTGYELTLQDLLYASLLSSDNRATRALARAVSGSIEEFVKAMNRKVKTLDLENTVFFDPTGLDKRNVSTAHEVAKILHYAYDYKKIRDITSLRNRTIKVVNRKNKSLIMPNTNRFIYSRYNVLAGKTGYIQAADYCLTTLIENKEGEKLTLVVLGVPGDKLRFREARKTDRLGFQEYLIRYFHDRHFSIQIITGIIIIFSYN